MQGCLNASNKPSCNCKQIDLFEIERVNDAYQLLIAFEGGQISNRFYFILKSSFILEEYKNLPLIRKLLPDFSLCKKPQFAVNFYSTLVYPENEVINVILPYKETCNRCCVGFLQYTRMLIGFIKVVNVVCCNPVLLESLQKQIIHPRIFHFLIPVMNANLVSNKRLV